MGKSALPAARRAFGWILLLCLLSAVAFALMFSVYRRATQDAIAQLYEQERLIAEEATAGIGDYFRYLDSIAGFLSADPGVKAADARGMAIVRQFYESQSDYLTSITRMGADGRIAFSFPDNSVAGREISAQAHVARILATRQPSLSSVFRAVQGYDAVAIHYPVYDRGRFAGSLALLVPFATLSRRYLEGIHLGPKGYAIALDQDGVEIFGQEAGRIGKSILETGKDWPSIITMAIAIKRAGPTGSASISYEYPENGLAGGAPIRKRAWFRSVPVADGYWTVIVTAPESEALTFITGFRNRLFLLFAFVLAVFGSCAALFARSVMASRRIEAERERSRVLAMLHTAVSQSPAAIVVKAAQGGDILAANPEALSLCGVQPGADGCDDSRVPVCPEIAGLLEAAERGDTTTDRSVNLSGGGSDRWFLANAGPVRDESGAIIASVAVLSEITELKRSEEEIRGFNAVLERTVAERTGELAQANRSLGDANEALQGTLVELRSAQSQLVMSEKLAVLGQLSASIAHQVNTPLGAINSASGNIVSTLGADFAGIFARYANLPPELRATYESLLSSSVDSSLRGPLEAPASREARRRAAIALASSQASADLAEEEAEDLSDMGLLDRLDEAKRLVAAGGAGPLRDLFSVASLAMSARIVCEAALKASAVVKSLGLYLNESIHDEVHSLDLGEDLDLTLAFYGDRLPKGITLEKRVEPGVHAAVRAKGLSQLWSNLIQNAVQAMDPGGHLVIAVRREGKAAVVQVEDNGRGIPPELVQRVFEPFFTTKAPGEGSGLGLAVSKRIVEAEGGTIGFQSEPGRTVFTVRLPLSS